ncbi:MAG: DUF2924 domain-containing protein [Methylocystis sp.]
MAYAATGSNPNAVADVTVAEMDQPAIDIAETLTRLSVLTIFELRIEWRRLHRAPPPMRLSRDLLIRGITYKLQERAYGGLSKSIIRKLDRLHNEVEASDARGRAPPISLKPGTRLMREWRGVTHTVLVHADGLEWNNRRYRSLTVVAREITGAHWSGPRFFGLSKRAGPSVESPEDKHADA